jgi:hypothetical protein
MVDVALLLARDHDQLDVAIAELLDTAAAVADRRNRLEQARMALASHAEGEGAILHAALAHVASPQDFAGIIAQVLAAHRTQESILRRMNPSAPHGEWVCSVVRLRKCMVQHAEHERTFVLAALRRCLPPGHYERLAAAYTAEKVRALRGLHPMTSRMRRDSDKLQR